MSDTSTEVETPEAGEEQGDERLAYRGIFQRMLVRPEIGAAIGAIAVWIMFWAVSEKFGNVSGAQTILDFASSPLGIMAVTVSLLMIGGEFDLSSGAATGAFGMLVILVVRDVSGELPGAGLSLWVALPVTLLVALGLGWFNGTVVNKTSLPSFIVTLASFFILRGAKLGYSKLIVEKIQVDGLNNLEPYALENNTSDKGYGVLSKVFAGEWNRNEHIWESRDVVHTLGLLAGASLLCLAVYEYQMRRNERLNPAGMVAFVLGIIVSLLGIWRLHQTDSVGGNWTGALLIGAGMLVATLGWCLWRYRRRDGAGSLQLPSSVLRLIAAGAALLVLAVIVARWLDSDSETSVIDKFSLSTFTALLVALVVGAVAAIGSGVARSGSLAAIDPLRSLATATFAVISTMLFLYQATEQGARAIFFVALATAGALVMLAGAATARRLSPVSGSAMLLLVAVATTLMAFFIRSESGSPKFRAQAFAVMLAMAALVAIWGVATSLFEPRQANDATADRTAGLVGLAGVGAIVIGLIARLLWVTPGELEAGLAPARFSVRILWFAAVTAGSAWVLSRTKFGSWTFAVGGNKQASRQVGVPADRTKVQLFMVVSAAAWLVGVLLAFRLNSLQANTGDGEEFLYIIAAVVGGTALTGGYGSTIGAAIGAIIMSMAINGIPASRWNSDWRFVFLGGILLLAVMANNYIRAQAESAR